MPIPGETLTINNNGDRIKLEDATGSTVRDFRYDDEAPWPTTPDGSGKSLTLQQTKPGANLQQAGNWKASTQNNGTPSQKD